MKDFEDHQKTGAIWRMLDQQTKADATLGECLWLTGFRDSPEEQAQKFIPRGWSNWQKIRVVMEQEGREHCHCEHPRGVRTDEMEDCLEDKTNWFNSVLWHVNNAEESLKNRGLPWSEWHEKWNKTQDSIKSYCSMCENIGYLLEWDNNRGMIWRQTDNASLLEKILERREEMREIAEKSEWSESEQLALSGMLAEMPRLTDESRERQLEASLKYWQKIKKDVFLAEAKQATLQREENLPTEVLLVRALYHRYLTAPPDRITPSGIKLGGFERDTAEKDYKRCRELYPEICREVEARHKEFRGLVQEWHRASGGPKDAEKQSVRRKILRFDARYPWVQNDHAKLAPSR